MISSNIIILATTIIILILVIFLFFFLYFKIKSSDNNSINLIEFPKETDKKIKDFVEEIKSFNNQLKEFLTDEHNSAKKIILDVDEKIAPFEKVAREKNDELKDYKQGYEYSKHKILLDGVIDTIEFINTAKDKIASNDEVINSYLTSFHDKLSIVLNNSGVEVYFPPVNTQSLDNIGCEVDLDTELTTTKEKNNMIHSVLKCGYRIQLKSNDFKYVKKALVKVYEYNEKNKV